jgi:dihydropteroate synthase
MILIALGANLRSRFGSPRDTLHFAVSEMMREGIQVLYQSPVYLTAPVPISDQPWYHNAVIRVVTKHTPTELLQVLQSIENRFGRIRSERNAPRIIDLDILAYHDVVMESDDLILPHPRLQERAFVTYPLRDVAADWAHPVYHLSVSEMIEKLPEGQEIIKTYRPLIMGIVNVTPDSFSDGGQYHDSSRAIAHGLKLIAEGADILDIGGESTRPMAGPVAPEDEQQRILPVIEGLRNAGALISVDTRNASTMRAALRAGAGMINDVSALTHDPQSVDVLKESDCRICLMHMQGTPETMQINPQYGDVVRDVYDYLKHQIDVCVSNGIAKERMMVDVGIGFGKTVDHNIALIENLGAFRTLGMDVLFAGSRKSFIEKICDRTIPPEDRLPGSLALLTKAYQENVKVIRVHDVAQTRQFLDVYQKFADKFCG